MATLHREGREKVGKGTGENKGLGPLGKWLKPREELQRGHSKAEDEGGGGEVREDLGPGVREFPPEEHREDPDQSHSPKPQERPNQS